VSENPPSPPPPPENYGAPPPPPPPPDYSHLPPPPPDYSHLPPPPPPPSHSPAPVPARGTNQYAKVALFLGLVGWLVCGLGSIGGVYYGFKALAQIKSTGEGGREMALAGIVIGLIMFVFGVLVIIGKVNS
jgi:hypothetical protein